MSLTELFKFLKDIRPRFEEAIQNEVDSKLVRGAVHEFDKRTLGFGDRSKGLYAHAVNHLEYMYLEKKFDSTKTEIAIFPLEDKILTTFYGTRETEALWNEVTGVDPYGYWDNTDADEDATEEEWNQRRRDWEEVLVGDDMSGIPALDGFGFQFTSDNLFLYTYKEKWDPHALRFVLSMEDREMRMAEFLADEGMSMKVEDAVKYATSDDRKQKISEQLKNVSGKLQNFSSLEDIFRKKWD